MLPFLRLKLHCVLWARYCSTDGGRFLSNSLRLLFYICFCSLLINTRLVFISYFVSVPLRKGHRSLEYQCSFVRLYLFLFAFLIICIETFCIFDYSYWNFWFFVDCFVTKSCPRFKMIRQYAPCKKIKEIFFIIDWFKNSIKFEIFFILS